MRNRVIDAHHHLWHYSAEEYGWIDESMGVLRCDYLVAELEAELRAAGVDGAIAVQARQSLEETQWLLQIAAENAFVAGVVGWVPLADDRVSAVLERFAAQPKLRGVRHVLQGEADEYMLRADFQRGLGMLREFGLAYDLLIHERQLASAIELVDAHPAQTFVLDHLAKPLIRTQQMEPWAGLIGRLAERANVYCKISGMVTEDDWGTWSAASIGPYIETVLEAFGPHRLMYGSDWPVCLVASSYGRWIGTVREAIAGLSEDEQLWIMGRTAAQAYNLKSEENA